MSNFHWPEAGFLVFIKQFLETGLPLKCWFLSYRNADAADEAGGLVQVAHAGDAIFLPAGAGGVCSMWGNCLDPIRRLEMIGFIDRPVPWLSRRLGARSHAFVWPSLFFAARDPALIWIWYDSKVPIMHICAGPCSLPAPSSAARQERRERQEGR